MEACEKIEYWSNDEFVDTIEARVENDDLCIYLNFTIQPDSGPIKEQKMSIALTGKELELPAQLRRLAEAIEANAKGGEIC